MKLRIRLPGNPQLQPLELDDETQWSVFLAMLEELSSIPSSSLRVLSGYPPKAVEPDFANLPVEAIVRDGDSLIVQRGEAAVQRGTSRGVYVPPSSERGFFVRRVCPADNSCLFHAVAYVTQNKSRTGGPQLRQLCADQVLSNPKFHSAVLLGMEPIQYAALLLQPTFWGGAIELMILSDTLQVEIITLDLQSARMERFGEDQGFSTLGFVVYTGKHYDAIAVNTTYNSPSESQDQVLFNTRDTRVIDRAIRFVKEEALSKSASP